ncbi:hypothetical protein DVA67_010050 [Solirubrobacter sp. CPCC 204708]|uniref:DUF3105 domain-containing protein n=1 Tax=Solirubrobacter deserti TaxID=2282478 RepID=A0ABT4RV32_9ACTN|nr:hypothetical protein [Solirubrobacter deserti]MBE2316318.1 hypothetical protein [Solirubrobacter deserti]MDA0142444.1 hypothetical protein [Solirubrobacter deserti]
MKRLILLAALALAGCGGNDDPEPKAAATPTATATATATPTATATATPAEEPAIAEGECEETKYKPGDDEGGTAHPAANFFEPGADNLPSQADLDHLLVADNAVVILYDDDLEREHIDAMSSWWSTEVTERTPVVVPDDAPDALPVRARIATVELRCNGFDLDRLTKFANRTDIEPVSGGHG